MARRRIKLVEKCALTHADLPVTLKGEPLEILKQKGWKERVIPNSRIKSGEGSGPHT